MALAALLLTTTLPALAAARSLPAGQVAQLVGLQREDGSRTDLEIADRGSQPATCEVALYGADGSALGAARTLVVPPSSPALLRDLLAERAPAQDVRAQVRCDQEFTASALVSTGTEERVVGAARELAVAADGTPACPAGSVCFDDPGLVLKSTADDPAALFTLTPPAGTYGTVKVHVEVQVNAFSDPASSAHGLLYMVRDTNKDMFASAFLRGPGKNDFTLRHGFNLVSAKKAKLSMAFAPKIGTVYALDYVYDPAGKTLNITLTDPRGKQVAHLTGAPNVAAVTFAKGDFILVSLSNSGVHNGQPNPQEPASLGWVYQNFHVELVPLASR